MLRGLKHCLNLEDSTFIKLFYHYQKGEFSWKMSLLVIYEILALFVNTLTAIDNYSLPISENLLQPVQMQLFKNQYFFRFFAAFLKSTSNFEHFEKKMRLIAYVFPKL